MKLFLNPSLLRRQPPGACRPLSSFGSGAVAASVSLGNLADASGTALKRLRFAAQSFNFLTLVSLWDIMSVLSVDYLVEM